MAKAELYKIATHLLQTAAYVQSDEQRDKLREIAADIRKVAAKT